MAGEGAVLVVGGSSGIGLAIAHEFAKRGHELILVARNAERLEAAAAQLRALHSVRTEALALDVTTMEAGAQLMSAVDRRDGRLRYAVLGVGAWCAGPVGELEPATLRQVLETNIVAQQAMARALLPRLVAGGGLLFVGSLSGCLPVPWMSAYAASKAGLHAMVMALRQEQAGGNCNISLLAPGVVTTGFLPRVSHSRWQSLLDLLASSPKTVARAAYRGVKADVAVIVPGMVWRLVWLGTRILPRPILARLSRVLLRPIAPRPRIVHAQEIS